MESPDAGVDGLDPLRAIRDESRSSDIVLTSTAAKCECCALFVRGARGYIRKGNVNEELLNTIRTVHEDTNAFMPMGYGVSSFHSAMDR